MATLLRVKKNKNRLLKKNNKDSVSPTREIVSFFLIKSGVVSKVSALVAPAGADKDHCPVRNDSVTILPRLQFTYGDGEVPLAGRGDCLRHINYHTCRRPRLCHDWEVLAAHLAWRQSLRRLFTHPTGSRLFYLRHPNSFPHQMPLPRLFIHPSQLSQSHKSLPSILYGPFTSISVCASV